MTSLPAPEDSVPPDDPLTTKEGWRRFVDYQPEPPNRLDPPELLAAALHLEMVRAR